jgi:hypothetical protein
MAEDLESLLASLDAEPEVEVNYDAPESGSFPPEVYPGRYDFIFKLDAETPFDKMTVDGKPYLVVNATHSIITPEKPEGVDVRFQRASFYKHPKMTNSDGGELLRSLGIKPDSLKPSDIVTALKQADGRARGTAVYGWEAYSKDTKEVISTNPRGKARKDTGKKDMAWPKGADGKYTPTVKFPESGDAAYGRVRVVSYKLPSGSAGTQ